MLLAKWCYTSNVMLIFYWKNLNDSDMFIFCGVRKLRVDINEAETVKLKITIRQLAAGITSKNCKVLTENYQHRLNEINENYSFFAKCTLKYRAKINRNVCLLSLTSLNLYNCVVIMCELCVVSERTKHHHNNPLH